MYGVDGQLLSRQYKNHLSDFRQWEQAYHAHQYVLFKQNIGERLSMDETCLSQGELYTIITNKAAKGGKGSLVAMIKGTKSRDVVHYLSKLPRSKRLQVKKITIDLSPSMKGRTRPREIFVKLSSARIGLIDPLICSTPYIAGADQVSIDQENAEMALAKEVGRKFVPHIFDNGDTRRQLLARSRHIVMKNRSKWTASQNERAEILFAEYPAIAEAYQVSMSLTQIYNARITDKRIALTKLARWYDRVESLNCKFFDSVVNTMQNNYATIANYFDNRSTNASAESFNAKVKAFRAQLRGIEDIPFFIFRLTTLFA